MSTAQQSLPTEGKDDVTTLVCIDVLRRGAADAAELMAQAVVADLIARNELGIKTYGRALQTFNGRNALLDFYQEQLDAAKYGRQVVAEAEAALVGLPEGAFMRANTVLSVMRKVYSSVIDGLVTTKMLLTDDAGTPA